MRRRFSAFTPFLLLALLTVLVFYKLAFTDMILARGDAYSYFYPYWDARNQAFQHGELPLWTPDIFMGAPLLANPQLGTFYPPNWLMTWLPAPDGIRLSILLHTLWAAAGMYTLFVAMIRPIISAHQPQKISLPALCAAVIYAFGGAFTGHVEQINQLQGLSWLPWLFYCLHRILTPQPPLHSDLTPQPPLHSDLTPQPPLHSDLTPQSPLLKERGCEISPSLLGVGEQNSPPFVRGGVIYFLLLAAGFALQIFSGHTQTVFISGAGLALYALLFSVIYAENQPAYRAKFLRCLQALVWLVAAAIGGILLALPQILPTLELTGMSYRGGSGFTAQQATAFSLPISYIGRSLLPSYDGQLFTEYMATPGVIGLALALLAVLKILTQRRRDTETKTVHRFVLIWAIITFTGLFFALGRYNPIYLLLAELPGFDLFRVPARWLALFGLGVALLAGLGVQGFTQATSPHNPLSKYGEGGQNSPLYTMVRGQRWGFLSITAALILLMFLTRFVFTIMPEDIIGAAIPTPTTLVLWGVALASLLIIFMLKNWQFAGNVIFLLLILELFAASQVMPFNDLAPRDVYTGQRFTISQMQALTEGKTPPGRMLAISGLLFDVGDKSVLEERFLRSGMDEQAIHTAFTAVKKQEMLFHNLPLTWGVPSVDGMDGGVLPTIYYSQFTSLLLPENTLRTTDGRLGEMLALPECRGACIPDDKYLRMMDVQYLITDKVYDVWHEGVAYDTAWRSVIASEQTAWFTAPQTMPFVATQINIAYKNDDHSETQPIIAIEQNGEWQTVETTPSSIDLGQFRLAIYSFDIPVNLKEIVVSPANFSATHIFAATGIDTRIGDFTNFQPVGRERLLSSDVKIYDYNVELSGSQDLIYLSHRASIVNGVIALPDTWEGSEAAVEFLKQPQLSYWDTVVINGDVPAQEATTIIRSFPTITHYQANRIEIQIKEMPSNGYLVLADAWYPGWKATVNGQPVPVYRANVMFRAVPIPAGGSEIIFYFEPDLWYWGIAIGIAAWLLWGFGLGWQLRKSNRYP